MVAFENLNVYSSFCVWSNEFVLTKASILKINITKHTTNQNIKFSDSFQILSLAFISNRMVEN